MVKVGLLVRIDALPGKEDEVQRFLEGGLDLVNQEPGTVTWYAVRLGPSSFAIFDTFADDDRRDAHLSGAVAAALGENAGKLFAAPTIEQVDVLAAKGRARRRRGWLLLPGWGAALDSRKATTAPFPASGAGVGVARLDTRPCFARPSLGLAWRTRLIGRGLTTGTCSWRACPAPELLRIQPAPGGPTVPIKEAVVPPSTTTNTRRGTIAMENDELTERIHALETAQAAQAASAAGAEATNAATTAGLQAAQTAAQAGTWAVMVAGSASLIVGMFLGLVIAKSKG